jgi:glycosyltransferase involved in cell wall biosynthesis
MKQRVKLLLAIPHLGGGGAERVIATLARCLDPQRFEIHLALLTEDGPGTGPIPACVTVHRFHASRVRFAWLPLLRLIRAERPDAILSGMAHLSFSLLLLKPFFPRGTAIFVRQNTTASAAATSLLSRLAYRFLYPRASRIICQSQGMADDLAHHFSIAAEKLAVLANPIDVEAIQAVQVIQAARTAHSGNEPNSTPESHDSAPRLLCVGRLSPEKGVDLLLRALPEVKAVYPNVHLTILGIGRAAKSLHQLSIQLGLENEVTFAGYADPAAFYATSTLFVLPSRYEGMPNALLEAAAAGLPIVVTPCCTGVTDLLRDTSGAASGTAVSGTWVTPAIDSEALSQTLLAALAELGKSPLGNSPNPRPRFDHAFLAPFELRTAVAAYASLLAPLAPTARSLALLIPTIDQIGGAERQVLLLAKEFAARGWRVSLIALSGNGQAAAQELASANVGFLSLQMRKAWVDPRGWLRYLAWFRANRPEVVHAHLPHATWFARWVHLLAPASLLVDTIHTSKTTGTSGGRGCSLGYRLSSGLTDQTTCVSQAVADAALRAGLARREKLKVIPNGVLLPPPNPYNPSNQARNPNHAFQWIAVGRLAPVKDYPTLLRAFAGLPGQPRLQIVGSGPEEARLHALAGRLQIQTRVHFAGFQANVQPLLEAADAFVLASLWEGLPVSVLEASATSLPVVATDAAGTSEAMIPGETGFLVPIADPDALTAAMTRIMTLRPAQRLRMGANGRRFVEEKYSLAKIADQWEQLYTQLLRNHPTPREEAETRPTTMPAFAAAVAPCESASSSAGETSCL